MFCLLQKALKDRTTYNQCNLQGVIYYHLECPDYIRKFDDDKNKFYLKRQIFGLLVMPYMNMKLMEFQMKNSKRNIYDFDKRNNSIQYHEELKTKPLSMKDLVLQNKNLTDQFVKDIEFEADPPADE